MPYFDTEHLHWLRNLVEIKIWRNASIFKIYILTTVILVL